LTQHRPELDGLRGVAVVLVLLSHTQAAGFAVEGGFAGVTLFFALSGYLITSLLDAEVGKFGRVDLKAFYLRRGLRLLPALFALLVVVATGYALDAWPSPPAPPIASVPIALVSAAAYVPNWIGMGFPLGVLGHTWSLGVEEQFYLAWPISLLAGYRLLGPRKLGAVLVLVAALVSPWRLLLVQLGYVSHVFAGTDTHADALLLGAAFAILRVRAPDMVGWLGFGLLVCLALFWPSGRDGLLLYLPAATVASVMALAGCPDRLSWRPIAYIGRVSYGLYLWHFLFLWWGWPAPMVLLVSLLAAIASYELYERHFLRIKDRYRPVGPPPSEAAPAIRPPRPRC
jgi:peptidoglycan/LPS O-acetylase OafA/YrhL